MQEKEVILLVEPNPFESQLIVEVLKREGFDCVDWYPKFEEVPNPTDYSVVLMGFHAANINGRDMLSELLIQKPEMPVIVLIDTHVVDQALWAMKCGAFDVLEKPIHPERLLLLVHKSMEFGFVRTEIVRLHQQAPQGDIYYGMVGRSMDMKRIFDLIERIKDSSVNVLITGPSGSGKEMVARALHATSSRANKKFVAINCSAIPDALLEGELFGYKKGAFTDARTDKIGLFQEADNGTIFLDEIGDMPINVQPKILRALQEKEIRPLGSLNSVKVNVRIIAATNQNLEEKIQQKQFREDLYYRLNAMQFEIAPLKNREEDIPLLIDHFLARMKKTHAHAIKGVSQKAMKILIDYSWPGNVRELENVIERATLFSKNEWILPEDLLFSKEEDDVLPMSEWARRKKPLADIEKEYILEVLQHVSGNRSETANILGIGRKTLYNKLAKYGVGNS
ncbi:MAG: hypothetical protein A2048_09180 [Deltaproteobacteria bacterium GWA2_45_12]|nr:MAG: hypothetical protein A2048_09180 [Deltaproteobacteria bacterium GWA2_45_12]